MLRRALLSFKLLLKLIVEGQIVVLFEVRDDFVGIEMFFFKFLMMRSALEGVPGLNILSHVLKELVAPSFFLRSHLVLVIFHEHYILSVL